MELFGIDLGGVTVAVGVLFLLLILFIMIGRMVKWITKVPPNRALLVYGVRTRSTVDVLRRRRVGGEVEPEEEDELVSDSESAEGMPKFETVTERVTVEYRIVRGGWTLVFPLLHEVRDLDLSLMTLEVKVDNVLSTNAVPITVDGIAQIKVGSNETFIATAAEQLLDKDVAGVKHVAEETLKGHLRAIIGLMTVEEVYKDRETFATKALEVAVEDLAGMGLEIVSFVIRDISDDEGYLKALGQPEIQDKLRAERVARAEANQAATEKEQEALKAIADVTREKDVAQAQFDTEVAKEQAVAAKAGDISLAEQDSTLETMKTNAAQQAAARRDMELEGEVRRPADADLYAAQQEADGVRATGFADADVAEKAGQAEAEAEKAKGIAVADVTRAQRLATADGIEAELLAEAKGRRELAESLNQYGPTALQRELGEMFINALPELAGEITQHIGEIDELRLVDLGGSNGDGSGVLENFSDQGLRIMTKILEVAPALAGGPIDDIVAALISAQASKLGVATDQQGSEEPDEEEPAEEAESDAETPEVAAEEASEEAEEETPPAEDAPEEETTSEPEPEPKSKAKPRGKSTRRGKPRSKR